MAAHIRTPEEINAVCNHFFEQLNTEHVNWDDFDAILQ